MDVGVDWACVHIWVWSESAFAHWQLDCIKKLTKIKPVAATARDFLYQIIWGKNGHPKCGCHLLVTAQMKGYGRSELGFFLLALPLAGSLLSCHCGVPLLMLEPQRLKTTALQESPGAFRSRLGLRRRLILWGRQIPDCQPLQWDRHCWTTWNYLNHIV